VASDNEQLSYYTPGLLIPWRWKRNESCTPLDLGEFSLASDKPAPLLRDQPPSAPKLKPAPAKREAKGVIEGFIEFREWLNTPSPPKPETIRPRVKPFDLQDIPGAMERIGWPMSAKVMRKWFAGELNYANTDDGAKFGINQDGMPFPPSMIDTTTFKLEWILGFPRAKEKYLQLISKMIFEPGATRVLKSICSRLEPSPYYTDTWKACNEDINRYHKEFQFQFNRVDSENADKFRMFLKGVAAPNGLFMDDLYGSLGAFSFNVALDGFFYQRVGPTRTRLAIEKISVYMRDVFTFHDRAGKALGVLPSGTQYLGHWNKTGFILIPGAIAAGEISTADWLMYPVARGGVISDSTVYYPVRNKDYREWQLKHKQGGDLVLYSDRKIIRFPAPYVVEFDL